MCLEESLYIHNIRDMKVLHTIRETPPNPSGEFFLLFFLNPAVYLRRCDESVGVESRNFENKIEILQLVSM